MDIPLIENTLVMNIGDMMEILSNGKYLATKHRVKKVSEERYSFLCSVPVITTRSLSQYILLKRPNISP
jgi:Isopenicillin N synthase and related dioxygenases